MQAIQFVQAHLAVICTMALFILSEAMALSPKVKANSVAQFLFNLVKGEVDKNPQDGISLQVK